MQWQRDCNPKAIPKAMAIAKAMAKAIARQHVIPKARGMNEQVEAKTRTRGIEAMPREWRGKRKGNSKSNSYSRSKGNNENSNKSNGKGNSKSLIIHCLAQHRQ